MYLTADSENTLTSLDHDKVYIIGGIVDHNRHKEITLNKALEQKISHAKFPIQGNIDLNHYSTVLTVNNVIKLMLQYEEHQDWPIAL